MHTLHTIGQTVLSIVSAIKPKPRIIRECAEAGSRVPSGVSTGVRDADGFWYSVTRLVTPAAPAAPSKENTP